MSSTVYNASVRMNPEVDNEDRGYMFEDEYPYKMPKVYFEGCGEVYNNQDYFNWADDSVVVVRDKRMVKYTRSSFVELLAENENGEIVWMDGRNTPYSDRWDRVYLNEGRGAWEYSIEEYDLETLKKVKYKVVIEETIDLDYWDYRSLSKFVDEENLGDCSGLKDSLSFKTIVEGNNTNINGASNISVFSF